MSGYEADDQRYQDMLCAKYRQAQQSVRSEDGILDSEIAEHVDLLVAQLQDANQRILALETELEAERAKTVAIAKAAAATPQIPEPVEEETFPVRALGYSWGTK